MGARGSRQSQQSTPAHSSAPAATDDVPRTEPAPPLVTLNGKYSPVLTTWLEKAHRLRRSSAPFQQSLPDDAVSYFELNYDILDIVLGFLQPKDLARVACVSTLFRALADDNVYWHRFFASKTRPCKVPRECLGNWKLLYQHAKEVASLVEVLGTNTSSATITVPPGIYAPMTFGSVSPTPDKPIDDVMLVGVPYAGREVVFETRESVALITVFGAASLHNMTFRHLHQRPDVDRNAGCALFVRGTLTLENCDITAGTRNLYGVYGADKSVVTVRNCRFRDISGPAVVVWTGGRALVESCQLEKTDGVEGFHDADITVRDTQINRTRSNAVSLGALSVGRVERCRLSDGGGQGVQTEGRELTVIDCDIARFQFSGIRSLLDDKNPKPAHNNPAAATTPSKPPQSRYLAISHCRISHCATGVLIDEAATAKVVATSIRQCTTAIEISDGGVVSAATCTLCQNKCGIAVSGPAATVTARECIVRKNEVGVRVAVQAQAELVGCDIRENKRYGVHVTRYEGEGSPHLADTYSANNDVALSGAQNVFVDELPRIEPVRVAGETLSQEVVVALRRGVCTHQLTGAHYRIQNVWRCLSCKLTDSRGMCDVCRTTCHADHEVILEGPSAFFCDCGYEGFCEVFARNRRALEAARLV